MTLKDNKINNDCIKRNKVTGINIVDEILETDD